jgi:hypothetical protein
MNHTTIMSKTKHSKASFTTLHHNMMSSYLWINNNIDPIRTLQRHRFSSSSSTGNSNTNNNITTTTTTVHDETVSTTVKNKSHPRGKPLKDFIPRYVRLKFCKSYTEDIVSDDEMDYTTYKPETDPDIINYVKSGYREDGNYDFTNEEVESYDYETFNTMVYNMLHKKRSRSTPSVKRAHHAWWVRMKKQQLENEYNAKQTNILNHLHTIKKKKHIMLIDEYASDDGTSIDYYSTECEFNIKAIRDAAIKQYVLPSDQEDPLSLIKPEDIKVRTYNLFQLQYYDTLYTKTWKVLQDINDVMYYVNAKRAIPLYVPKEYHSRIMEETEYWKEHQGIPVINDEDENDNDNEHTAHSNITQTITTTLDEMRIGDPNISNQERGRRIKALIRKYNKPWGEEKV